MDNHEQERIEAGILAGLARCADESVVEAVIAASRKLPASLGRDARVARIAAIAKEMVERRCATLEREVAVAKAEQAALPMTAILFPAGAPVGLIH